MNHSFQIMQTIGLLGGMSAEATAEYYRLINAGVNRERGGWAAAELLICSVNFAQIEAFIRGERWAEAAEYLVGKAQQLQRGGADFIVMATNTMHRVAPQIEAAVQIPLVHIVDVTAVAIRAQNLSQVGVLGTKPVMEADFYRKRFQEQGIQVIMPNSEQRQIVDQIIFDQLVRRLITSESRQLYLDIMQDLIEQGAEGIVLGCTEIALLVGPKDFPTAPLFDTTALHCQAAVRLALGL
jgi:aspartate racemase